MVLEVWMGIPLWGVSDFKRFFFVKNSNYQPRWEWVRFSIMCKINEIK